MDSGNMGYLWTVAIWVIYRQWQYGLSMDSGNMGYLWTVAIWVIYGQ